jgi:predicted nucleic acid-binding protein
MSFVLDTSVTMAWCFEDEMDAYSNEMLKQVAGDGAVVPGLWPIEVVNVLVLAERRKRLARADAARFLDILRRLPIQIDDTPAAMIFDDVSTIARDTGLTAYDAVYLSLAMTRGLPLATRDAALRKAARDVGVKVAG